jgi:hypothetical protein
MHRLFKVRWSNDYIKTKLRGLTDRHLSAKLVPTFADRRCDVVSVMDPYAHFLGFLYTVTKLGHNYTVSVNQSKKTKYKFHQNPFNQNVIPCI